MEEGQGKEIAAERAPAASQPVASAGAEATAPVAPPPITPDTSQPVAPAGKERLWRRIAGQLDEQSKAADAANKITGIIAMIFSAAWLVISMFALNQLKAAHLGIEKLALETDKIRLDMHKTRVDVASVKQAILQSEATTESISHDLRPKIHIEIKAGELILENKTKDWPKTILVEVKIKNSGKKDVSIDLLTSECFISHIKEIADREKLSDSPPGMAPQELILNDITPVGLTFYPQRAMSPHSFVFGGETDTLTGVQEVKKPGNYLVSFVLVSKQFPIWTETQKSLSKEVSSEKEDVVSTARAFIHVD